MIKLSRYLKVGKLSRRALLSLVGFFVLVFLLMRMMERLPSKEDWGHFATNDTLMAAVIFSAIFFVATALRCLRFGYLIRRSVDVSWGRIAIGFPWLFFIGAITPFRIGEGMRAVWVRRHHGNALTAIGYWIGEKLSDTLVLVLFLFVGGIAAPVIGFESALFVPCIGIALAFCCGILCLYFSHLHHRVLRISLLRRIGIDRLMETFTYMHHTRSHLSVLVITFAIWLVMAFAFHHALRLLLGDIPFSAALLVLGAVNLSSLITVVPGNLGGYQAAMVFALSAYDIDVEPAFMASVVLHGVNLIVTITMGFAARTASLFFYRNDT